MNRTFSKFTCFLTVVLIICVLLLSGCNEEEIVTIDNHSDENEEASRDNDLLSYLGKTALEILVLYGYPDYTYTIGGSVYWKYERSKINFYYDFYYYNVDTPFNVEENAQVFAVSSWEEGTECYNTKLGMTFSEIESALGYEGDMFEDLESDYIILFYHIQEIMEGITDVELWFYAKDHTSPTETLNVIWKGY